MRDLIIGTAGHIDHGKTALVRALTGIDTDRLAEEKRRGITIDIGFAHMLLGDFRIGFIDVPGHEKFVKNMLAGIGGIHLLLFVIAADESVMPQTVEHFQICRLLAIRRGIVVLTKRSLVDEELLDVVRQEVAELVAGSFLEQAPVVAVDSLSGAGIDQLKQAMLHEIELLRQEEFDRRIEERVFQLPVDRVFTIRGFGTVVTGTAVAGSIRRDEPIRVLPGGFQSKVRSIEIFGAAAEQADAGQRTALNLPGVTTSDLRRGMTVCPDRTLEAQTTANVRLELLPSSPSPLRHRMPVRFHHGSGESIARVYLLGQTELRPGQAAMAQIRLAEPAVLLPGDRFVLRRYSPLVTIGGGLVLDNRPPRVRRRQVGQLVAQYESLLPLLERDTEEGHRLLLIQHIRRKGLRAMELGELVAATGLKREVILELVRDVPGIHVIDQDPPLVIDLSAVDTLGGEIRTALETYHERHPLAPGMPREELRERFLSGVRPAVVQYVFDRLDRRGIIEVRASHIALEGSRVQLSERQEKLKARLIELLRQNPFQAPGPNVLAERLEEPAAQVRTLFYYLIESGEILRISEELTVLPDQLDELVSRLRRAFPAGRTFSVPEFKELLGLSRKYAIPVLEYLDRMRVTRRVGDGRTVVPDRETAGPGG
ncbi:MAG: selenocysteine-specific translation elongation factor [Acidobacteriota bacterium]